MPNPNITKFSGGQSLPSRFRTEFEYVEDFEKGLINIENDEGETANNQPVGGWRQRRGNATTFVTLAEANDLTSSYATFTSSSSLKTLFSMDSLPINTKQGLKWSWETMIRHDRTDKVTAAITNLKFRVGLLGIGTVNPALLDAVIGASTEGALLTFSVGTDASVGGKPDMKLKTVMGFDSNSFVQSSNDGFAGEEMIPSTFHSVGMESDGDTVKTYFDGRCVSVQGSSVLSSTDCYVRPYGYVNSDVGNNTGTFSMDYFYASGQRGS